MKYITIDKKKFLIYGSSFLLPFFIFVGALIMIGNYPFGNSSFAIWDCKLQYLDFFSWLKRVFNGEASLLYSFGKSLGGNTIALVAYYLSSPFNLLLFFFDDIQLFVVVITTLKISCCGLTCSVYLKNRFDKMDGIWVLLLSSSYALMTYNLAQSSNIMWIDGVVFLPLIVLGVYHFVVQERKGFLYISVTAAILSNWYTAYMSCLFAVFYFFYEKLLHEKCFFKKIKEHLMSFMRFCMVMLLAVGSSMFLFLPAILNLLQGKADPELPNRGFSCTFWEVLEGLLPGNARLINSSTLVLFCGSVVLLGLIGYFLNKKTDRKEKIISGFFTIFLLFSAIWMPLENVWNGFRNVYSYYCRFGFILSFFMIFLAASFFEKRQCLKKRKWIVIICGVYCFSELFYNAYATMDRLASENAVNYCIYAKEAEKQADTLKEYDANSFYRTEQTSSRGTKKENYNGTYNEGMAYGFSPLASYTSTYDAAIARFHVKCGYTESNRHMIMYNEPILLSDSLLGIKYLFSNTETFGYKEVENLPIYNKKKIYQNPYALNLGYAVGKDIQQEIQTENSFEYQNQLLSKMIGEEVHVYKPVDATLIQNENEWCWSLKSPECDNILYGYLTRSGANSVDIYIDDIFRTYYSVWTSYKTFQISNDQGTAHTVCMKGTIRETDGVKGVFYYLDMDEFSRAITKLQENEFDPAVFEDGYVEGVYVSAENGKLLLTIPYDKGWVVTCNGTEITPEIAQEVFMVLPVEAGENHIVLRYETPGLKLGILLSSVSVTIFLLWMIQSRREQHRE